MAYNSTNRSKLKMIDLSDNTSVPATTGTNIQTLQPPAGFIYKIKNLTVTVQAPAGAGSGTHEFELNQTDGSISCYSLKATSAFGASIQINDRYGLIGDATELPAATSDQFKLLKDLVCSNSCYLTFTYSNKTDVANALYRYIYILVEEIPERI